MMRNGRRAMGLAMVANLLSTASCMLLMTDMAVAITPQQRVLDHLRATFGVKHNSVETVPITARDLPAGASEFYVEAKGSHGHDNYNYVVIGESVYCSRSHGEFARILKEQKLLDRQDTNAAQLMHLYSLFALPHQIKYIDQNALNRNPQDYRAYPEIKAPYLENGAQGALVLSFFATPVMTLQPSRWTVTISRSYEISIRGGNLTAR
jgi:hypothetical protein